MPKPTPSNAAIAAAEIAHAAPSCPPGRAAAIATELCSIGRAYQRAAESRHDPVRYTTAEQRMARHLKRASELVAPFSGRVRIDTTDDGLVMLLECRGNFLPKGVWSRGRLG